MKKQRVGKHGMVDGGGEDMLSDLPDKVILRILSSLGTEESIRTGVLSRRWKSMWKKTSNLRFDSKLHSGMFAKNVIKTLTGHQNRELDCLTLKISGKCDPYDLAIMFTTAFSKGVGKLVLILDEGVAAVSLPVGTLNCQNTLTILKLKGNMHLKLPALSVSLDSLRELHLYHVRFVTNASVENLLRGCPVLEELVVVIFNGSGVLPFIIDSPSLLRLTIGSVECQEEHFVIRTPCLRFMNVKMLEGVDSFQIEDAGELVRLKFSHHDYIEDENILASVNSVQFLSISGPFEKPFRKIFYALSELEFYTITEDWCELLTFMLICSPKLQVLKLRGGWNFRGIRRWTAPVSPPDCVQFSLLTLDWPNLRWREEDDVNVATYILKNAPHLMKATFTTWKPSDAPDLRHWEHVMDQLSTLQRASSECQICFEDALGSKRTGGVKGDPDVLEYLD